MVFCRKNHETHTHLQAENYAITKEKIQVKKEIGCPLKLFLERNRIFFTLISFSKENHPKPKKSMYKFKAVVSNTNLKNLNRL